MAKIERSEEYTAWLARHKERVAFNEAVRSSTLTPLAIKVELDEAQGMMHPPLEVIAFIQAFCAGKHQIRVGHMMFSTEEGISNLELTYFLSLLRSHEVVEAYLRAGGLEQVQPRLARIAEIAATEIVRYVVSRFAIAHYPGD